MYPFAHTASYFLRTLPRRYRGWSAVGRERVLRDAADRHARASGLPGHEFSDEEGRMDKVRFLRREHMFVDWSSWHSALRDEWRPPRHGRY